MGFEFEFISQGSRNHERRHHWNTIKTPPEPESCNRHSIVQSDLAAAVMKTEIGPEESQHATAAMNERSR